MKVLGASGGIGLNIVRIAAEQGHDVTAITRSPISVPEGVRVVVDDVMRPGSLDAVLDGEDIVLSALGLRRAGRSPFAALASPPDFTSASARLLVEAMAETGVTRVMAVSAAGVGDSADGLNWFMRLMIARTNVGLFYKDLNAMEDVYARSGLDFCCVRPTGLADGPESGRVRQIHNFPLTARISRADVAWWMVEHVDADFASTRHPIITGGTA